MKPDTTNSTARITRAMLILCVIQPLLDVLSYWVNEFGGGTSLTLGLRMLLLIVTAVCGYTLSSRKKLYGGLLAVLAFLAVGHIWACLRASGISGGVYTLRAAGSDLANFVRVAQLPIFALVFSTFLRRCGEEGWRTIERALLINFFVILAVELISAVTGTNPYTYPNKSIGLLGWFYFANCQSAILSMLCPMVLCIALRWKTFWKTAVVSTLCIAVLWLFATRLAYLAIFLSLFGTLIIWAINRKLTKRIAALLLVLAVLCGITYPISPMTRNQRLVTVNAGNKQAEIDFLVKKGTEKYGDEDIRRLEYAYARYQKNLVKKYGLERMTTVLNESDRASVLADARLKKLNYCRLMMEELPASSRWFGVNYNDMVYHQENFDVENDFHAIAYLYGYAGLAAMAVFLLYFIGLILWALIKNFRRYLTVEAGGCGIALMAGMIHAYETAGMLRRPNATFYLSLVLAMIWYLVRAKTYDDPKEEPIHG